MNIPVENNHFKSMHTRVARIVLAFWLLGWFLKADFYIPYLFHEVIQFPFIIDPFPSFFRSALVLQFFYLFPILAFWALIRPNLFYLNVSAFTMVLSSIMLLLHQDTHNDATFITSFWVGIWFLWFVNQLSRTDKDIMTHARSLALCVVGVVFLGGFVGKLTEEYWSGEVFADIFLRQNFGWIGLWIRGHFQENDIYQGFWWIAKVMIVSEGILALAPLWPLKFVRVFGIVLMVSMSTFTTWRIFSVLSCLIGLLYALRYLESERKVSAEVK